MTIARTAGLQSALNGKQNTINDGDLTIARTAELQSALNGKQNTINDGDLTIAKTSGLLSALNGKQNTISDGDLTIAKTSGLQTELSTLTTDITTINKNNLIYNSDEYRIKTVSKWESRTIPVEGTWKKSFNLQN